MYLIVLASCVCLALSTSLALASVANLRRDRLRPGVLWQREKQGVANALGTLPRTLARLARRACACMRACCSERSRVRAAPPSSEEAQHAAAADVEWRLQLSRVRTPRLAPAKPSAPSAPPPKPGTSESLHKPLLEPTSARGADLEKGKGDDQEALWCALRLRGLEVQRPAGMGNAVGTAARARMFALPPLVELNRGDVCVVVGPSGCGKSLLLRAIASLDAPLAGAMTFGGAQCGAKTGNAKRDPRSMGSPTWRGHVCYVPQLIPQLTGTPFELLEEVSGFGARATSKQRFRPIDRPPVAHAAGELRARFTELAASVGLESNKLEQGWDALSGGERHRAAFALALTFSPAIILVDEPTAATDHAATERVEALILGLCAQGMSAVWVTHDMDQAARVQTLRLEFSAEPE